MKSTIVQSAKSLSLFVLLIIVGAMFTACSDKELVTDPRQDANAEKTYTMVVNATKGDDASTRALSLEGKTLNATWAEGERVTVYNVTKDATLEGYLEAQSDGASTTLKGTLTGTIENGDELKLKFLSPTYGTQDGTLTGNPTSIDKVCDYAEATVEVTNASTASVTTTDASFENKQAIVKFTLKDKGNSDAPINATSLNVNADGSTYTVTPASATDELFVAVPAISSKTVTLTATDGASSYNYEKTGATFENGKYYEINVKMTYDPLATPLTFEARTAGATVTFTKGSKVTLDNPVEYSTDGTTWATYSSPITLEHIGDKVSFRSTNTRYAISAAANYDEYCNFSCDKDCYLYGNIMSLINKDNFATNTTLTGSYTFCALFDSNSTLYSHASKELKLPATTLAYNCYEYMFYGCTNLTTAPELLATTLTTDCYNGMFWGCTGLTTAPELPAITLSAGCYETMFYGCTGLTTAPELPATTLAGYCYSYMFGGCTGLTTAPALPAKTLAQACYHNMFNGCTGLTSAPELPAATLAQACYHKQRNLPCHRYLRNGLYKELAKWRGCNGNIHQSGYHVQLGKWRKRHPHRLGSFWPGRVQCQQHQEGLLLTR